MTMRHQPWMYGAACGALLALLAACAGPERQAEAQASDGAKVESPGDDAVATVEKPDAEDDGAKKDTLKSDAEDDGTQKDTQKSDAKGDDTEGDSTDDESKEKVEPKLSDDALRAEARVVLDDWHDAADRGDRKRYLAHFTPDAVFQGTDATERWDLAGFTLYVEKAFVGGHGWTYTSSQRHVVLGPQGNVAWFDEMLESSSGYSSIRGTGVLRRDGDQWRIAFYSMTFTIPNGVTGEVSAIVRGSGQ